MYQFISEKIGKYDFVKANMLFIFFIRENQNKRIQFVESQKKE
jgi:hypothetical protein